MNILCFRFFTVYGRRGRPEMAIAKFTKMINEDKNIPVYGYGEPKRDYSLIDDIIQEIIKSIDHLKGFELINIGECTTVRLDQLIKLIEKQLGKKAKKEMLKMHPGDVAETFADIQKNIL